MSGKTGRADGGSDRSPPRIASALIRRLVPGPYGEDLLTELTVEFERRRRSTPFGRLRAAAWFWRQAVSPGVLRLRRSVMPRRRTGPASRRHALEALGQDLRDAWRAMRRAPGHAATVIVTFALAVGANVAVFSVINSVLLRPLPYPEPGELITIQRIDRRDGISRSVSGPDFIDWRDATTSFSHLTGYTGARETFLGDGPAEEWLGIETTPGLFAALGVAPLLGRTFTPGVDPDFGGTGIVLSHALWQQRFHGDSAVVGRSIRFEDRSVTVIGVMPAGFSFPTSEEQYWAALGDYNWVHSRGFWTLRTIGRLAPGVELAEAQREMSELAARIDARPDADSEAAGVHLETRHEAYVGETRRLFAILAGAVVVVLAIACSNIANLGLTRSAVRRREFAIRAALGASTPRVARQLLSENLVLALIGAAAGLGAAHVVVNALLALGPGNLPRQHEISVDATAIGFAVMVAVACGVIFGVAPALAATGSAVGAGVRQRAGSLGRGKRHYATLKALVVSQIALSQVLIVAAGLLLHSFVRLSAVRPGFDTESTLTMQIHLPREGYDTGERVVSFHDRIAARLGSLPGVRSVGLTSHLPFTTSDIRLDYHLEAEAIDVDRIMHLEVISQDYLSTMGIPLRVGRDFTARDGADQPMVALINERMAQAHWPGSSPIGERFTFDGERSSESWVTVIGVVGTVLKAGLDDDAAPVAYLSLPQFRNRFDFISGRHVFVAVRSMAAPEGIASAVRSEITTLDDRVAVTDMRSTGALVADSVAEPRFRTVLIASFAGLAVLVALVGIYGMMGFVVGQRTGEIGIRMALGANARGVLRQVLGGGAGLIAIGLVIGTVGAVAASRLLSGMLYGVSPADPLTFGAVTILLAAVAIAACWFPAKRASRVDPLTALRADG